MTEMIVNISLLVIIVYLFCGLVFAAAFITKGITVVDEEAHAASLGFKIIIIPGVIALWPFLLNSWVKKTRR